MDIIKNGVIERSILGPVFFYVFIKDTDNMIKCTLSKFADKLNGVVDTPKRLNAIQRDKVDKWAHRNLMRFNKVNCKDLHLQAALHLFILQSVLIPGFGPTQVQHHALDLGHPHEIPMGTSLKIVQVPLDGIPSFRCGNCTTQHGAICQCAECALGPFVYVINENIK
ncbi:hypothetical protein WISP_98671 [Willisornis vidua]|uniref:Reverse transcriptase domain-containing protein n=1 Tax=Willisornis vidua TaxID=1566151 RepID=A0ABQ9D524_9PASS|nr:hypothetical protein WISP_98671 [Willisornis vidua]